jgi:hypothetical protein
MTVVLLLAFWLWVAWELLGAILRFVGRMAAWMLGQRL